LLYISGRKNDAMKELEDTIKELKSKGEEEQAKNYTKDLLKMKNGTL